MGLKKEIKKRYPREATLQDGRKVSIRPMTATDGNALAAFFKRIPVNERDLFKDDVTDPAVIRKWCENIDFDRILPLLALDGDRIVADTTLHRNSIQASRHVASVKVTVDPEYRANGLALILVGDLIELAPVCGVAYIDAEVMPEQKRAQQLFEELEFQEVGTLPQHVRDLHDKFHDIILMTHMTMQPERLSPDAWANEDTDIGGQG